MSKGTKKGTREVVTSVNPEPSRWSQWKANPEAFADLCKALADGVSSRAYAAELGISHWELWQYATEPERRGQYARALEARASWWADEVERLANDKTARLNDKGNIDAGWVQMRRTQIDTLKWVASKFAPAKFGDKVQVDATVTHDVVGELRAYLSGHSRFAIAKAEGTDES